MDCVQLHRIVTGQNENSLSAHRHLPTGKNVFLMVEKIRFNYREGKEKYTAEEWITDKYALNKSQTNWCADLPNGAERP